MHQTRHAPSAMATRLADMAKVEERADPPEVAILQTAIRNIRTASAANGWNAQTRAQTLDQITRVFTEPR